MPCCLSQHSGLLCASSRHCGRTAARDPRIAMDSSGDFGVISVDSSFVRGLTADPNPHLGLGRMDALPRSSPLMLTDHFGLVSRELLGADTWT